MIEKLQDRKNNLVGLQREAIARADNFRLQARLATDTAARLGVQITEISDQIRDLRPVCCFESEADDRCTRAAAWRIEFPDRLGRTGGFENYGTTSKTPHTFACSAHLPNMASDDSDQPTLITRVG